MKSKTGVISAIVAAVSAYMEEEEMARQAALQAQRPAPPTSVWRMFGRMELMRARVPARHRRG